MKTNNYKSGMFSYLEIVLWTIIAFIIGFRVIIASINGYFQEILYKDYYDVVILAIVILFPFLFKLIYSEFPLQYLRNKRLRNLSEVKNKSTSELIEETKKQTSETSEENVVAVNASSELNILKIYLEQSQKLSEQIYLRSSAYLLIGCLIAFAGVGFFYFQLISLHSDPKLSSEIVFTFRETLPRIGVLIFVEAIAFFFLRQYKSTMEEFRYYEAIKRQRENQFLVASCGYFHKDNVDYFSKLINALNLNDNPNKLLKEETTQLIETQKISGPESDVIEKFIDLLKIVKK